MQAEQIVARLTDAQRAAIINADDKVSNLGGYPFFTVRHTGEPWPVGIAEMERRLREPVEVIDD